VVGAYLGLLALLACERGVEIVLSRRHAAWAFARGGIEFGRGQLLPMRVLHVGFMFGCALEVVLLERPFLPALGLPMLFCALAAQGLRYWAVHALGKQWNIRIIVVPGLPRVIRGPYRLLRHPNYLAVVIEGIAVPLVHSAWLTALIFTTANACLLAVRIRCEEAALAGGAAAALRPAGGSHRLVGADGRAAPRAWRGLGARR
jgi:methyltransferase